MAHSQIWNVMFLNFTTGFICSYKYVKQVEFWLIIAGSPPRYKGDGDWSSVYSQKNGGVYIFPSKGRDW